MRITNGILHARALSGVQRTLGALEEKRLEISSGLRVRRPSDDPEAVGSIMETSSELRALEQYRRNLSRASSRLQVEEGVLQRLGDALSRAKELAVSQASDTATPESRNIVQREVDGILSFVRELGNTRFGEEYLFGGPYADTRPFPPGGPDPTRSPSGTRMVEGSPGTLFAANHGGMEIFVDTGALSALEDLSTALGADSQSGILGAIEELDTAFDGVQQLVGELGARMNQVDSALENLDALDANLRAFRSALQDTDMEEAISELVARQVTYQAALLANARILDTTLTDYLR